MSECDDQNGLLDRVSLFSYSSVSLLIDLIAIKKRDYVVCCSANRVQQ